MSTKNNKMGTAIKKAIQPIAKGKKSAIKHVEADSDEDEIEVEVKPVNILKNSKVKKHVNTTKVTNEVKSKAQPVIEKKKVIKKKKVEKVETESDNENKSNNSDVTDDQVSQMAESHSLNTEFMEKIIKYVKVDDHIKRKMQEHREEMKVLKNAKKLLEDYISTNLSKVGEKQIVMNGTGKLIRTESTTKSAMKVDDIKNSIQEILEEEGLVKNEDEQTELIQKILTLIDSKRVRKSRTYLKRTRERKKKGLETINEIEENDD
jgi:hypothetical protein